MAKSFFDRLTGSVKADEEKEFGGSPYTPAVPDDKEDETEDEIAEEEAEVEEPQKPEIRAASVMAVARPRAHAQIRAPRSPAATGERKVTIRDEDETTQTIAREEEEEEGQLTVDIFDDGNNLIIQSTVAGVKPEDLDLSITNDMITIRGKRARHEEVNEENYYYKELYWGTFSRSVILPEEVDSDEAEATLKNGLLTVKLPKKQKDVKQKIKVKME